MADDERTEGPAGGDAPPPEETAPESPPPTAEPPPATTAVEPAMPPQPPGAGPAPRKRQTWLVVLLGVIGLIAVVIAVGTFLFVDRTLPPYSAANDFVDDLADGKVVAAADQLCAVDADDPEGAIATVTRHFAGRDNVTVNPFGVARDGDRATVDYTVSSDNGDDDSETFELPVREEDGDWKPCPSDARR